MFYFHEAPGASYDLIHLGLYSRESSEHLCLQRVHVTKTLTDESPHARMVCWWLDVDRSSLPHLEVGGLEKEADKLLEGLRNLKNPHDTEDRPRKPVIFLCRGMAGGLVLKQVLLRLIGHANSGIDKDLHDSISGVVFLGCAHDERSEIFNDRVLLSLDCERGFDGNSNPLQLSGRYGSVLGWANSTTANFRKLKLPFPVWTYYESVASEYEREERFLRSDRVHSEIFCPSENTKLQASPYRTSILDLDHDDVCDIFSYRKLHSKQFLEDLREMVDTLRSSKFGVSSGVSQTGKRERAARESVFVMVPETYDGSTSSANDRFPKHAGKPHVNNKSNELSTSDSPQNGGLAPAIMDYKFGWICALSFEAAAAEVMLDEQYPDLPLNDRDSTLYRLGRIERHNVVIACLPRGRPGLSAATAVARDMLEKFRGIRFGFMVGIGGGVPSVRDDIRLGDVVVSQPNLEHGGIVQYDFGKAEEGGRFRRIGHLNSPPTLLLSVLNRVQINHERGRRMYPSHMGRYAKEDMEEYTHPHNERDVLFNATYPHTGEFDCKNCDPDQIVDRPERKSKNTTAKIHYGTIASGNQVIKDAQTRDRIVRDLGGQVLCFEMEAAGLMNDLPCLVIRGISDYCDSHKNDGWQKYAAASAAAYTRELLLSIPSGDVVG